VAYECLTGAPPFGRDRDAPVLWAHRHEAPRAPSTIVPDLPADTDEAVLRGLAKEPARLGELHRARPALASAVLGARAAERRD
jgi:hypothetical protein